MVTLKMKKLLFILLFMPCWCMAQDGIKSLSEIYTLPPFTGTILTDKYKFDTVPTWPTVPIRSRPTFPEPGWPERNDLQPRYDHEAIWKSVVKEVEAKAELDSLKKELLKCQEKSKVDELIIERLFEGMKKNGVTVPTTLYTATYDSLGNIYFREK